MRAGCIAMLCAFTAVPATRVAAAPRVIALALVNGALTGGDQTLEVQQGDDVELRWSSDQPIELHLHGYDIEAKVSPQMPAVMAFKARIPGRFPIEPHGLAPGHHRAVVYLEVRP
jgi:FtsP/CotA-like multicopper oxidase with cupredoxin domain